MRAPRLFTALFMALGWVFARTVSSGLRRITDEAALCIFMVGVGALYPTAQTSSFYSRTTSWRLRISRMQFTACDLLSYITRLAEDVANIPMKNILLLTLVGVTLDSNSTLFHVWPKFKISINGTFATDVLLFAWASDVFFWLFCEPFRYVLAIRMRTAKSCPFSVTLFEFQMRALYFRMLTENIPEQNC